MQTCSEPHHHQEIATSGLEAVAYSTSAIQVSVHDLYRFQAAGKFGEILGGRLQVSVFF